MKSNFSVFFILISMLLAGCFASKNLSSKEEAYSPVTEEGKRVFQNIAEIQTRLKELKEVEKILADSIDKNPDSPLKYQKNFLEQEKKGLNEQLKKIEEYKKDMEKTAQVQGGIFGIGKLKKQAQAESRVSDQFHKNQAKKSPENFMLDIANSVSDLVENIKKSLESQNQYSFANDVLFDNYECNVIDGLNLDSLDNWVEYSVSMLDSTKHSTYKQHILFIQVTGYADATECNKILPCTNSTSLLSRGITIDPLIPSSAKCNLILSYHRAINLGNIIQKKIEAKFKNKYKNEKLITIRNCYSEEKAEEVLKEIKDKKLRNVVIFLYVGLGEKIPPNVSNPNVNDSRRRICRAYVSYQVINHFLNKNTD